MHRSPILIVEDDPDDQEMYADALKSLHLPNEIVFCSRAQQALDYLNSSKPRPFLILSDVNMPQMNGMQFREAIQSNALLREKCIPFIFVSTNASQDAVRNAHQLQAQGYFQKPDSMNDIRNMLQKMIDYWTLSKQAVAV